MMDITNTRDTRRMSARQSNKLRTLQNQLGARVLTHADRIADPESNAADLALKKLNHLHEKGKDTTAQLRDAELLKTVSALTGKQARKITAAGRKITPKLFIEKLFENHAADEGGGIDWSDLGRDVGCFFRGVPFFDCMLGPTGFTPVTKVRQRAKRAQKQTYEERKPEEIKGSVSNEKVVTEHEKQTMVMKETLRSCCRTRDVNGNSVKRAVGAFDFLVNPASFSQTVENIFDFAFLIKDGWAGLKIDEESKLPVITTKKPKKVESSTAVISFSLRDFNKVVDTFSIEESIIPHRERKEDGDKYVAPRASRKRKSDDEDDEDDDEDQTPSPPKKK